MLRLKLMYPDQNIFDGMEIVEEQNKLGTGSTLYIQGPYTGVAKNKNKRVYPKEELDRDISRYINEMVNTNRSMGELNHSCSLSSSDILTQDGWKSLVDVKVGDLVPTLNKKTQEIEIHPVKAKINEPYKGKMLRIKGRNIDLTVTPNHRFPVVDRYGNTTLVEIQDIAANRMKYDHSYIPKHGNWVGENPEKIIIDGVTTVNKNIFKEDVSQPLEIDTKVFVQFLGIWLAEGHTANRKGIRKNESYTVAISQKKEPNKTLIREMLEKFPIKWNEFVNKDGASTFYVSDIRLFNLLNPLGKCYDKYIPHKYKQLSAPLLEELIYWFNLGDGRFSKTCHNKNYIQRNVFTVSRKLIDDLHECLVKSGGCGNITTIDQKGSVIRGRVIKKENTVPLYQLSIATSKGIYLTPRFLNIEEVEVDENIYCVSVENETFYIRENDKACWSGNSTAEVNPERACHMVTKLYEDNGTWYGKSKILSGEGLPIGNLVKGLINQGVSLGVSTRSLGTLEESTDHNIVRNLHIVAWDMVADPSFPTAFVNGILESREFVIGDSGKYEEFYSRFDKGISKIPRKDADSYLREQVIKFINSLN